jgi:ubiquinone/menaquinone biosynthesis C-methylase UbiE
MSCCGGGQDAVRGGATTVEADSDLRESVRRRYAQTAERVQAGAKEGCGCGCAAEGGADPITSGLYQESEKSILPEGAVLASLGCGNPTALAELRDGDQVLDLGSGGGIDVLLSARRVAPSGKVYGLDMTDEMLGLARENQRAAGVENAEFLKGEIEEIPLPDASVDVVISNCVINLSVDKRRVLAESFRVLRPGGRFAVSDVVVDGELPPELRRSLELWVGCVAGALDIAEFRRLLDEVGFQDVDIEPTRVYRVEDAREFLDEAGVSLTSTAAAALDGRIMAAFVRGRKPMEP